MLMFSNCSLLLSVSLHVVYLKAFSEFEFFANVLINDCLFIFFCVFCFHA